MRAAIYVEPGRIILADKPIHDVGPHDAFLRITTTTICRTEVHILKCEYSPDFNPVANAFAKLKKLLPKAAAHTVDHLWHAIGESLVAFTPNDCANDFAAAGYEAYSWNIALVQITFKLFIPINLGQSDQHCDHRDLQTDAHRAT